MAHDANFVGNRLRLSAFILCVEHEGMPARPSRFSRQPQILDKATKPLVPIPPRIDCNVSVPEAYNELQVLTSKTSTKAGAIMSCVDEEAAMNADPMQISVGEEEDLSKGSMHVTSINDAPQSPVLHLSLTPASANDQDSHNRPEEGQRRSKFKRISHSTQKVIATTSIVEKTSRKIKELSSTRKRRLLVHELALLRTTTLDGPMPNQQPPLPGVSILHKYHCDKVVTS
jgi:hypothetical protein